MKVSAGLVFAALLFVSSLSGCLGFVNGVGSRKMTGTSQHHPIKLQRFQRSAHPQFKEAVVVNGLLATAMLKKSESSLTHAGLLHATALGVGLWSFLGVQGWLVCAFYFAFGSLATKVKMIEKERLGIAEKRHGARGPENVWGSAATAMIAASGAHFFPEYSALFRIAYVAALASKLSDTLGSELGKAYGKSTYLITTLQGVPRGTEGAVSVEGTLSGVVGSVAIAAFASALQVLPPGPRPVLICAIAAFVATTAESFIGAVWQSDERPWLTNELVNFTMTAIGAGVAAGLTKALQARFW